MYPDGYIEGIRLFNKGHFWHAHEQWEACWLTSTEPDYTFYKGIIQAAGALHHWKKGNLRGLRLNWAKSRPKLVPLLNSYKGLDLQAFITSMDQFVASQENGISSAFPQLEYVPLSERNQIQDNHDYQHDNSSNDEIYRPEQPERE